LRNNERRFGWGSFASAVLLHLGLLAVAVGAWWFTRDPAPREQRLAIEATVVHSLPAAAPVSRPAPEPVPEPVPEPTPEAVTSEREQQLAAAQQAAEAKAAEVMQRKAADARQKAAQDKAEKEELAKEKAAKEKIEKEKADKEKAEKEKLVREKAAAERARAELNAQIAAEERLSAARASGQMDQYVAQITARIERAWIRPPGVKAGLNCEVSVTQVPGGTVTAVQVKRCNGDETVRQSIEAAVYRASPLPLPTDPGLFERELVVTFRPQD
jgi:colicin import membrane protein